MAVIIPNEITSGMDSLPEGKGLWGELIRSTSRSKKSLKIMAELDKNNPSENPNSMSNIFGIVPRASAIPITTQTPAEIGSSGRINSSSALVF